MKARKQTLKSLLLVLTITCLLPAVAFAAQTASPNYQLNEVFFGSGGALNVCSTNYCSKQAAGEITVGHTGSTNFQAQGGFNTDRTPYIEFNVSNSNIDLGTVTSAATQTATASFSVKAYLAQGYTVVNASDPPSNNGYIMTGLTTPTASATGTEQFGMNLVANTNPVTFGANPAYIPDATFSFGQVAPDYSTANLYKYLKGDVVALSTASTSTTTYTISYIFNISNVTPGGTYVMHHVLVATGTY